MLKNIQNKLLELRARRMGKRGVFGALISIVIGLAAFAIGAVVTFLIQANLKANTAVAADGNATAAVNSAISAAATVPTWLGIIVIATIGSLLLGIVYMYMRQR